MRFFHKRRAFIDIDERGSEQVDHNNADQYYGVKGGAFGKGVLPPCSYEEYVDNRINEHTSDGNEYAKNKQSIGKLARKLNCSASKKHDFDFEQRLADGVETEYWGEKNFGINQFSRWKSASPLFIIDTSSEITRPVLITVKNGDMHEPPPLCNDDNKRINHTMELKSSFVVGEFPERVRMGTSSSFRLGMSARKRHHNATKYFKNRSEDNNDKTRCGGGRHNNIFPNRDIDARRAVQEAARRERWKRGLEMEKRMFKNATTTTGRDKYTDDSSSTDSLTLGSHTTRTSVTGYDTGEDSSSIDDWTDATDDSRLAPIYHHRYHQTSSGGHCSSSKQVVESVTEDFGIFAKLLLSDGYACLGTAAEITKETVGGCKYGKM